MDPVVDKLVTEFQLAHLTTEEFWTSVEKQLKVQVSSEVRETFWELESYLEHTEIYDWAERLRESGAKIAILSNVAEPVAKFVKENKGYDGFDPVILSYEVGYAKPDPKIYKLALERLGLKADQCIFVDDQERFLAPAEKLGMQTLLAGNMQKIRITFGELMGRRDWKTASSAK